MRIEENYSLEKHNTFHLPVKARWFMEYTNEEELGRIFRDEYFQECLSLHIGSGSNLLFINDFNGVILHSQIKGISVAKETDDSVSVRHSGRSRSSRCPKYRGIRYGNQGCGRDGGDI